MSNMAFKARLKHEKNWLEKYYYGEKFRWRWESGKALFERDITTSRGIVYRLRILVGENYPDQLPDLVVCRSPKPMPKTLEWQGTHTTHTWPQEYGLLQICFYHPLCWTRQNLLYQVFEKGMEWLEAYEEHLATGVPMKVLLPQMIPTEEEVEQEERRKEKQDRDMALYDENLFRDSRRNLAQ